MITVAIAGGTDKERKAVANRLVKGLSNEGVTVRNNGPTTTYLKEGADAVKADLPKEPVNLVW